MAGVFFIAIFVLILLAFIVFCFYGLVMQGSAAKKGRRVDARVLSCEVKLMSDIDGNEFSYYIVTVDFYGLNGETIVKTVKTKKRYMEGTIIRSMYLDKEDQLWLDMDASVKNNNSARLMKFIVFLVAFLIFAIALFYIKFSEASIEESIIEENITGRFKELFGYIIGIIFIGIGILGIRKKLKFKKDIHNMTVIDGTQVDFYVINKRDIGEPNEYYPIYEFELMGEIHRYQSNIGGSLKKYRNIGRKVHIIINSETGKVMCKEDELAKNFSYLIFGVIGVLVLLIMLSCSFGLFKINL